MSFKSAPIVAIQKSFLIWVIFVALGLAGFGWGFFLSEKWRIFSPPSDTPERTQDRSSPTEP